MFDPKEKLERLNRALLIGVQTPDMPPGQAAELLEELVELTSNLGIRAEITELVRLREPHPHFLIGSGKAAELTERAKEADIALLVFDAELSPAQQRNWEEETGLAVIDRQEVILEIFTRRAQTREAKLQVELARLEYSLPRLTRAWTHLSRQRGRGIMGGEGETQLEVDRRIIRNRIAALREELIQVVKQRAVQRNRRHRIPIPTAAIVGYTNAGKSSLLRRLTGAQVLVEDKLFATLDPTTRQLALPDGRKLLMTDTVGFIRRLPHRLVEAFKATLEETVVADFILHVIDFNNPSAASHAETTLEVLQEIGATDKPIVTVYNKIDLAPPETLDLARVTERDAIFISTHSGEGIEKLLETCSYLAVSPEFSASLILPHDRYELLAKLHASGGLMEQKAEDDGVHVRARIPNSLRELFEPFIVHSA